MKRVHQQLAAILIYGLAVVPLACKSGTKISGDVKERQSETPSDSDLKDKDKTVIVDSEAPSIPNAITGALLTCVTKEANDKVEVNVGCRYVNEAKVRVLGRDVAKTQKFTYSGVVPSGITVTQLAADAEYEATFNFKGTSFASLLAASKALSYAVQLTGLVNGEADTTIGGTGVEIVTPPAPRWVRDSGTDLNKNGVCDGSETCVYVGNGLMWLRDNFVPRGQMDASAACEQSEAGYTDWVLTTNNQLLMAFEKSIWDVGEASMLNIADSHYWTTDSPAKETPTSAEIYGISRKLNANDEAVKLRTEGIHLICVRPAG